MCLNYLKGTEVIAGLDWVQILIAMGICCLGLWISRIRSASLKLQRVLIANSPEECRCAARILIRKCSVYRAVGFDCEWVTLARGRRPVALLQLATVDGFCTLIRLCKWEWGDRLRIPFELKELLEDPSILKVGVVPSDDAEHLFKDYGIVVQGCLDLRHLVLCNGGSPCGLSGLAENVLGVKMDKSWNVRCGNWESEMLSEKQVAYAANDAWFAVKIFEVLALGKLKRADCNLVDWFKSHWQNLVNDSFMPTYVWNFVDIKFHTKANYVGESNVIEPESSLAPVNAKQKLIKSSKVYTRAFCTRQNPLYQNCFMQAPDGAVLCTCDRKKAMWYVSKDLAELIDKDPLTVRLKFEPSGRAVGTVGQYYTQTKANCCVVCGKVDNCMRKNVVPHEYRRHFPKIMKDHVSHDVLLMCLPCHLRSNSYDLILKKELAEMCSAPFCQGGNSKTVLNREKNAVKAAARALTRNVEKIPSDRQESLGQTVKAYFNVAHLTNHVLQQAAALNVHTPNEDYDPHGLRIVQFFSNESNGGLTKLEQMWRQHFLRTMNPKYMPSLWSVTHTQDRLEIRALENRVLADELCVAGMKECVSLLEHSQTSLQKNY